VGTGWDGAFRQKEEGLKVGYHAPPKGSRSGIADYAETLRRALQRFGDIESRAAAADIHLYHVGNNRLHENIYERAIETPGIAVLHDAVLHHLMLGRLSREEYAAEWVLNYGEWRRDAGEELWRERARAAVDPRYFQFPMLRRIAERSRCVVVHNPGAAAIAAAHGAKDVRIIPHFCERIDVPHPADVARFRERMGIGQGVTLFGMFGYLREPKRVVPGIQVFKRLHAIRPNTALLLCGEVVSRELQRLLMSEADHPAIRRVDHLPDRDFTIAAAAVDCCLNLRYPGAGETSGVAVRLMGLGKPVIVTDNAENSGYPPGAALCVTPGIAETAELFENMLLVTDFPRIAREVGSEAQLHIQTHHALESIARQYWEVLCEAAVLPSLPR
jgi:glycosyltransferase involved in cell wall biosynthesis